MSQKEEEMSKWMTPLPRYQCHKKVWALKIKSILKGNPLTIEELEGILNSEDKPEIKVELVVGALIEPEEAGYDVFPVSTDFILKHDPQPGGYWIQYEDGYTSYSPAKAFEEGYTRL